MLFTASCNEQVLIPEHAKQIHKQEFTMPPDSTQLALAEQILDEMIEAEREGNDDYKLFVKHFDDESLKDFGPTTFKREMMSCRIDLGAYISREYLGALKGHVDPDYPDKHPECIRYNWRGIFEKNETLITLGIHKKDGEYFVNEIMYR